MPTEPESPENAGNVEANPEHPEKAEVELELSDLDKVAGGAGPRAVRAGAPTTASSETVGIHQIVPITPDGDAEQATDAAGVFQIEAI